MARLKKKRIVLAVLSVLLVAFLVVLGLFWPVLRSVVSVERLEEGLYAMEYRSVRPGRVFLGGERRFLLADCGGFVI